MRARLVLSAVVALLVSHLHTSPAAAQLARLARVIVLQPAAGRTAEFEAGYRRHLEWHRAKNDPWTWHGWNFVLGERLGMFMDGTFGHAPETLDRPIDPVGDAADNAQNVLPFAAFVSHSLYELLPDVSSPDVPDTTRLLELTTYRVTFGCEREFEALVAGAHHLAGVRIAPGNARRQAWFRLRAGGPLPEYLRMRPVDSFSSAGGEPLPERIAAQRPTPSGCSGPVVTGIRSELLRHRPDLSYIPWTSPPRP